MLELDADVVHPTHRGVGIVDQERRKLLVDTAFGNAVEIGQEVLARVGRHDEIRELRVVDIDELANLTAAVVDEAKAGMRIAGIAAELALRGLFQHDNALGAGLASRDRRFMGRAPAANNNDVAMLLAMHSLRSLW